MTLACKHGISTDKPSWEELPGRLLCATVLTFAILGQLAWADRIPNFQPTHQCNVTCNNNCGYSENSTQCLLMAPECPPKVNGKEYLHFCQHLSLKLVVDPLQCDKPETWHDIRSRDTQACLLACEFETLLSRYDCSNGFSAKWHCSDCWEAYKLWVCAMLLPVYERDTRMKPCREFCHQVEEQCPYFHPVTKEQYAGEPVFICIDPNIPELPSMSINSSYGQAGKCYRPCHLNVSAAADTACNMSMIDRSSNSDHTRTLPSLMSVLSCVLWVLIRTRTQLRLT